MIILTRRLRGMPRPYGYHNFAEKSRVVGVSDDQKNERSLPEGWVWTTLGEIANVTQQRTNPQQYPELPFIGMEHVEAHSMRLLSTVPAKEMRSSAESFAPGDVLYGRLRPYLNKVYSPDFVGLCSGEFIVFRKNSRLESKYLQYFLNSWDFVSFASHLNMGDRPRVHFSQFASYPFPLAPLPEQHRIVAAIEAHLTRLDVAVAALERVRRNLARYKAAVLQAACTGRLVPTEASLHCGVAPTPADDVMRRRGEAFPQPSQDSQEMWKPTIPSRQGACGECLAPTRTYEPADILLNRILAERRARWEAEHPGKRYVEPASPDTDGLPELPEGWCWATVEQIGKVQLGRQRSPQYHHGPNMRPYLRAANATWKGVDLSDVMEMDFPPEIWGNYCLREGDILLSEASGSSNEVGKPFIWKEQIPECGFQNTLLRVQLYALPPEFIHLHFLKDASTGRFGEAAAGVNIQHLGAARFSKHAVAFPPLAEQHRIVAEVERRFSVIQELEILVATNLTRAARLRQSILKRAFEGRLVPQDPNDEPAGALLARIKQSTAS